MSAALVSIPGPAKSTLIKILSGACHTDRAEIRMAGQRVDRPSPTQMIELGVAVIHQELMLAPHLTVAENLFLGRWRARTWARSTGGPSTRVPRR